MSFSMVGKKCGMTRTFTENGISIPVTVIHFENNYVAQVKTDENDGYKALQIATFETKKFLSKAELGHLKKHNVPACKSIQEIKVSDDLYANLNAGDIIKLDLFADIKFVNVTGITIGKGFAGTIKRHHFAGHDNTHGNSLSHRVPGSIGQRQTPGRVFKGKRMSGHLGNAQRTIKNLEIVKIDTEKNIMLVKGAIPGAVGGYVTVKAVKN